MERQSEKEFKGIERRLETGMEVNIICSNELYKLAKLMLNFAYFFCNVKPLLTIVIFSDCLLGKSNTREMLGRKERY
jgi:hypothetical protein